MKFSCKKDAIAFIESTTVEDGQKQILIKIVQDHALDNGECNVEVMGSGNFITGILFQSELDVEFTYELDDTVIYVHSLSGVSAATFKKETVMTAQNQTNATAQQLNEMEEAIAASMKKVMEASLDSVLDTALERQKAQIDETVKKSVDEAVKKAVDEAMKSIPKDAETKKAEEPKKPSAEQTKKAVNGFVGSLGKTAAYMAGAVAVATGGYFAWKKWGGAGSTPTAV